MDVAARFAEGTMGGGRRRPTILLVEDEPLIRLMLNHVLQVAGYTVLEARDRSEALEHCRTQADIALIISDLCVYDGERGSEIARAAQLLHPRIKVLYISAYDRDWIARHESRYVASHVLTKPFKPESLLDSVRRCLADDN